ncbi:MAG: hypothetical protein Ct9H300mP7_2410 [Verrucomicrobiota bacterium]|nr:MAG: hypothetical protein Ct9H300mP7_2410 [Verrucomicrobiota bacterium]
MLFPIITYCPGAQRWIHREKNAGGLRAFEKYLKRFGNDWVEQRVVEGVPQVRLKTYVEYRSKIAVPGNFLLMQSQEITDQFQGLPIHLNATNLKKQIPPQGGAGVAATMQKNIDAVLAQRKATGQPMFPHINHPNFGWAIQPSDMIQLRGEQFFEVYNGHPAVNNYGDTKHLSTGQIWDVINAYRLGVHKLPLMFGLGTDDAHNYHDFAGRQEQHRPRLGDGSRQVAHAGVDHCRDGARRFLRLERRGSRFHPPGCAQIQLPHPVGGRCDVHHTVHWYAKEF